MTEQTAPRNRGVHNDGLAQNTRSHSADRLGPDTDEMSEILLIPQPFKGTSDEDSMRFITQFEAYAKFKNLKDDQLMGTFPLLLRDGALTWFDNLPAVDKETMTKLKQAFTERYGPQAHTSYHQVAELFQRTQKPNEKVLDYISDMRRRASLLKLPEPQTLQAILHGLTDSLRPFVLQHNPKDLASLESYAKIIGDATPIPKASKIGRAHV